jgi:AcrR family transcriptional regulator
MSRGRSKRAGDVAADQHRRIVAAVGEAISRWGYDGIVVEQIIGLAGVSRRTFYDLFTSKGDAFRVAHAEALALLADEVGAACEGRSELPGKVGAAIPAALEWAARERCRASLVAGGPFSAGPHAAYCHDRLVTHFAPGFRRGRRAPAIAVSPTQEEALLAGLAGIVAARLRSGQAASLPPLAPELVEFALTPYLGAGEARRSASVRSIAPSAASQIPEAPVMTA